MSVQLMTLCTLMLFSGGSQAAKTTQKFAEYPIPKANECTQSAHQDEVYVCLKAMDSDADQITYFHTALSSNGFLPLLVVVQNKSTSKSLLVNKGAISYGLADPGNAHLRKDTTGEKVAVTTMSAIPVFGAFIAMGVAKDVSQVKQNLMLRELQSGTLSPGETMHGFLYVPIPKKGTRPTIHLQFPIAWAGSDQTTVLPFNF